MCNLLLLFHRDMSNHSFQVPVAYVVTSTCVCSRGISVCLAVKSRLQVPAGGNPIWPWRMRALNGGNSWGVVAGRQRDKPLNDRQGQESRAPHMCSVSLG